MNRIPVTGGPTVFVVSGAGFGDLAWLSNDTLVLSSTGGPGRPIVAIPTSGGKAVPVSRVAIKEGEETQRWPRPLPDGRTMLYTSVGAGGLLQAHIGVTSLETGESHVLDVSGTYPIAVVNGQLLYISNDGTLMAVPFDERRQRTDGQSRALIEGIPLYNAGAAVALSANGTLVYVGSAGTNELVLVDTSGSARVLLGEPRRYAHPRYSPDGRKIAMDVATAGGGDIWIYDIPSRTLARLTTKGNNERPEWMPNSRAVLFSSARGSATASAWRQSIDGNTPAARVFGSDVSIREVVATSDGRWLLYREDNPTTLRDIRAVPLDGQGVPKAVAADEFDDFMPRPSPDGQLLAYISDESGQLEVYVRRFAGTEDRVQVSDGGGTEPLWSRDGRKIYYRRNTQMVAANIRRSPTLAVADRSVVFSADYELHPFHPNYDVAPDGRSFLMLKSTSDGPKVRVVVNWTAEMRAKSPTR